MQQNLAGKQGQALLSDIAKRRNTVEARSLYLEIRSFANIIEYFNTTYLCQPIPPNPARTTVCERDNFLSAVNN